MAASPVHSSRGGRSTFFATRMTQPPRPLVRDRARDGTGKHADRRSGPPFAPRRPALPGRRPHHRFPAGSPRQPRCVARGLNTIRLDAEARPGIKIYCGLSFNNEEGIYVVNEDIIIEQPVVSGMSLTENETQVFIKNLPLDYSLIRKMFEKTANAGLNVDMISIINTGNQLVVSFTIIESKRHLLDEALSKGFKDMGNMEVEYHTGNIKLSVVGVGMRSGIGVASSFFKALQDIPIKLVTTSEIKISCLIEESYKQKAVDAIVKEFNL